MIIRYSLSPRSNYNMATFLAKQLALRAALIFTGAFTCKEKNKIKKCGTVEKAAFFFFFFAMK